MRKRWILILFTTVFAISAVCLMVGYEFLNGYGQNNSLPWMFKGAYATYEGQVDSRSTPYSINATIQVTELNATHIRIQTDSTIATSFAPALSDQTSVWVNKTNVNFQPPGETLAKTYSTQITVKGNRTRDCTVYDYTNEAINATFFIDKDLLWPVRIVYVTSFEGQTYTLDFYLKDTNINGLN